MVLSCSKILSTLLRGITSKHQGDFYCLNCLHSFSKGNKPKSYDFTSIYLMQMIPKQMKLELLMQQWLLPFYAISESAKSLPLLCSIIHEIIKYCRHKLNQPEYIYRNIF